MSLFRSTRTRIEPILEDLVIKNIVGGVFIAVYGVQSDEVYALRRFLELAARLDPEEHPWDPDHMWTDCDGDKRMKKILLEYIKQ